MAASPPRDDGAFEFDEEKARRKDASGPDDAVPAIDIPAAWKSDRLLMAFSFASPSRLSSGASPLSARIVVVGSPRREIGSHPRRPSNRPAAKPRMAVPIFMVVFFVEKIARVMVNFRCRALFFSSFCSLCSLPRYRAYRTYSYK